MLTTHSVNLLYPGVNLLKKLWDLWRQLSVNGLIASCICLVYVVSYLFVVCVVHWLHVQIQCATHKNKSKRDHANCATCHVRTHESTTNSHAPCWLYVVFAVHVAWTFCCANKHIDSRDRIGVRRDHKHIHCLTCIVFVVTTSVLIDVSIWPFFCLCWRGASMFLDSVLKFYFPVSVRIAFACCSVASNMLIGVFTPCDHKHVDWLSHIAFCCGYVTLRIWRGPNRNPAMHPGLQEYKHGFDVVTYVNMRTYPSCRRQGGTAYQTECQVRPRSKTKSVFAACTKISLWDPWRWIWWRITSTTIWSGYARRWWRESRVARKPNTQVMLGCESKSEVLHVRTSTTGHGWHQGASPLSTPTTIISCDFVLLLHYLACD